MFFFKKISGFANASKSGETRFYSPVFMKARRELRAIIERFIIGFLIIAERIGVVRYMRRVE